MDIVFCIICKAVKEPPFYIELGRKFYLAKDLPQEYTKILERSESPQEFSFTGNYGFVVIYSLCERCGLPPAKNIRAMQLVKDVRDT